MLRLKIKYIENKAQLPNGSPVARGAYDLLSGNQNFKQEARTGA